MLSTNAYSGRPADIRRTGADRKKLIIVLLRRVKRKRLEKKIHRSERGQRNALSLHPRNFSDERGGGDPAARKTSPKCRGQKENCESPEMTSLVAGGGAGGERQSLGV